MKSNRRAPTPARAIEERSAGGVVIRRSESDLLVLLIRDPYRNWGLPKGHLEAGESSEQAALREVLEETGLECTVLGDALDTIDWYFRRNRVLVHKFCEFYLMECAEGDAVPEVEEGITECRWMPMNHAIRDVTYDNARTVIQQAARLLGHEQGDEA